MNIINDAKKVYGKDVPELSGFYNRIALWSNVFSNRPPWARVKKSGLFSSGEREMSRLGAAKVLADEFSRLTFSERINISAAEPYIDYVLKVLDDNGFWKQMPEFLSAAYALGGGVMKIYADGGKPCINYVDADLFIPMGWNEREIFSGAFESRICKDGCFYTLFDRYYPDKNGGFSAEHRLFKSDRKNSIGEKCSLSELYPGLPELVTYRSQVPMFRYFKPGVSNNVDRFSPLGISVFDGTLDTLKALDIAFDSFSREFILGKKRIIVPSSCIRTVVDMESGQPKRYFDADDEAFIALKCDDEKELKISDNTVELRVEDHVSAINALLNLLCFQTGLSAGTFSFDSSAGGIKTATEVISQNSKTARTAESNKNLVAEFVAGIVESIIAIGIDLGQLPASDNYGISVSLPDGIIIDDNTKIENNIKLVSAGLRSRLSAIMDILNCDEASAQKELDRITGENTIFSASPELSERRYFDDDDSDEYYGGEERASAKTISGIQTQSLLSVITKYKAGELSINQAVSIISAAMGISREKARQLAEGQAEPAPISTPTVSKN